MIVAGKELELNRIWTWLNQPLCRVLSPKIVQKKYRILRICRPKNLKNKKQTEQCSLKKCQGETRRCKKRKYEKSHILIAPFERAGPW